MESYAELTEWFVQQQAVQEPLRRIARPVQVGSLECSGVPRWAAEFADGLELERAWGLFKWLQAYKQHHASSLQMLVSARIAQIVRCADGATLDALFGPPKIAAFADYDWALLPDEPYSAKM